MSLKTLGKHPSLLPLHAAVMLMGSLTFIISYHSLTKSGVNWKKVKDQTDYDDYTPKFFHWKKSVAELEEDETLKRPDYKNINYLILVNNEFGTIDLTLL